MNTSNISTFCKNVHKSLVRHSPEILMAAGITGMVATTVLAVKATPKALQLIEQKKKEEGAQELSTVGLIEATWKCYIPAATTGIASIACLIGANSVQAKRTAALAAAYKLSETAITEYRGKVLETLGEKKERVIREKVAEERIQNNPPSKNEVVILGKEDTLFYDPFSGRYFKTDIEKVKRAENVINHRLYGEMYISLNEFYDEIGLPHTELGNSMGWNMDDGLVEMELLPVMAEDGRPCLAIEFNVRPKYDYSRLV